MLFLGCLFDEQEETNILNKSGSGLSGAVNTFQWSLIRGLDKVLETPIDIVNVLPVGTYPNQYKDFVLNTKRWSHLPEADDLEIGSVNLPVLKQIGRAISCRKVINKRLKDSNGEKKIIIYSTYLPFLWAVYHLPDAVKVTLIVTDLPEYYDLNVFNSKIKKFLRRMNNSLIYAFMKRIDSFIILTEQMKNPLDIGERPYVVIEGIVDINEGSFGREIQQSNKKIILYTGTLNYQFGIRNLLEAFHYIDKDNYELWICGSGEATEEIINMSMNNRRIKYLGYVNKSQVYELQQQATLLINPRTNDGEYTKYSFPSKTMEYMLSGKPVLMYKLDGVPDEYDNYLYYVNVVEIKDLAVRIMDICEKSADELFEFGQKARQFVIENKNSKAQAGKIINMINSCNKN